MIWFSCCGRRQRGHVTPGAGAPPPAHGPRGGRGRRCPAAWRVGVWPTRGACGAGARSETQTRRNHRPETRRGGNPAFCGRRRCLMAQRSLAEEGARPPQPSRGLPLCSAGGGGLRVPRSHQGRPAPPRAPDPRRCRRAQPSAPRAPGDGFQGPWKPRAPGVRTQALGARRPVNCRFDGTSRAGSPAWKTRPRRAPRGGAAGGRRWRWANTLREIWSFVWGSSRGDQRAGRSARARAWRPPPAPSAAGSPSELFQGDLRTPVPAGLLGHAAGLVLTLGRLTTLGALK